MLTHHLGPIARNVDAHDDKQHIQHYKQKEKPKESNQCQQFRHQGKWISQAGLFILMPYRIGIKKQSNWQHVGLRDLQVHVVSI